MSKIVAIHIAPSAIRLMEGSLQGGRLLTGGHAIIEDAQKFFTDGKLVRLREMVEEIILTMDEADIRTKNLYICYDNGVTVDMLDTPLKKKKGEKKGLLSLLTKDVGGGKGKNAKFADAQPNGVLEKSQNWGEYVSFQNDQEIRGTVSSVAMVERDLVQAITYEFAEKGYKVESIEAPQTAMMYLRNANPYSYDNMASIMLYVQDENEPAWVYTFMKNTPSRAIKKPLAGQLGWSLADRIVATVQREEVSDNLRRPVIMLGGDSFARYKDYEEVADALVKEGFAVFDLYDNINGLNEINAGLDNALRIEVSGERDIEIVCGRYTLCMSMLLRMLDNKPDNLMDLKDKIITKSGAISQARTLLIAGIAMMVIAVGAFAYEMVTWKTEESKLIPESTLSSQLTAAQTESKNMSQHVQALNATDERYAKLLSFISGHIGTNVNVASIDTEDMLETDTAETVTVAESTTSSDTENTEGSETSETAEASTTSEKTMDSVVSKQKIIVRGYARSSAAVKTFYSLLTAQELGETELVGIQCTTIQQLVNETRNITEEDGTVRTEETTVLGTPEEVYVFEIDIF